MIYLLGFLVLLIALACPIGWAYVLMRKRPGAPLAAYEPRRIVPWDGPATLLILALYVFVGQIVTPTAAQMSYRAETGTWADEEAIKTPAFLLHYLPTHVVFNALLLIVGLGWLFLQSRATIDDVGLSLRRIFYDVRLGFVSFVLVIPPVLLIMALLTSFFSPSQHPLMEGLKRDQSLPLMFWSFATAVIAAPVVEEFFFRGVLQGWFERLFAARSPAAAVVDAPPVDAAETLSSPPDSAAFVPPEVASPAPPASPRFMPILLSSLLFALAHFGYGPDPVPIFILALALGYLYRQTHRLWPGMVLHLMLNGFSTAYLILAMPYLPKDAETEATPPKQVETIRRAVSPGETQTAAIATTGTAPGIPAANTATRSR